MDLLLYKCEHNFGLWGVFHNIIVHKTCSSCITVNEWSDMQFYDKDSCRNSSYEENDVEMYILEYC